MGIGTAIGSAALGGLTGGVGGLVSGAIRARLTNGNRQAKREKSPRSRRKGASKTAGIHGLTSSI